MKEPCTLCLISRLYKKLQEKIDAGMLKIQSRSVDILGHNRTYVDTGEFEVFNCQKIHKTIRKFICIFM